MTRWQEQVREKFQRWEGWEGRTEVEVVPGVRVEFADDAEAARFVGAVNAGPCAGLRPETLLVLGVDRMDVVMPLLTSSAVVKRWSMTLAYRRTGWNCFQEYTSGEFYRFRFWRGEDPFRAADFDAIEDAPGA